MLLSLALILVVNSAWLFGKCATEHYTSHSFFEVGFIADSRLATSP